MSPIIRAEQRLRAAGEISSSRRAGVIFRDSGDNEFLAGLEKELRSVLHEGPGSTRTSYELADDDQGMRWVILEDGNFPDLVSSTYTVGNSMSANGASGNLLAAVFQLYFTGTLTDATHRAGLMTYWIYRYDLMSFYPFVPTGDAKGERDRPVEVHLSRLMGKEGVSVERQLEEWLGLWGIPF